MEVKVEIWSGLRDLWTMKTWCIDSRTGNDSEYVRKIQWFGFIRSEDPIIGGTVNCCKVVVMLL